MDSHAQLKACHMQTLTSNVRSKEASKGVAKHASMTSAWRAAQPEWLEAYSAKVVRAAVDENMFKLRHCMGNASCSAGGLMTRTARFADRRFFRPRYAD